MTAIRFLTLAALLAALAPVHAQNRGSHAADCAATDAEDYEAVYACISSFRHKRTGKNGFDIHFSRSTISCPEIQNIYALALEESGVKRVNSSAYASAAYKDQAGRPLVPSCAMLAKIREDWTGEPPAWHACLDFDPARLEQHMPTCLTEHLRGWKNSSKEAFGPREATNFLPSCEEALRRYEHALRDADGQARLPDSYKRPDCETIGRVLTAMQLPPGAQDEGSAIASQWGACLDYDRDDMAAHMEQCMEGHTAGIMECATLISAYEERLRAAYGGSFPVDYLRPKCFDAEDMIEAERIAREERRKQGEALLRQMEAARAADRNAPPPSWEDVGAGLAKATIFVIKGTRRAAKPAAKAGAQIIWGGIKELLSGD